MASENKTASPSFENYSWESDEEWQILIRKLEFPVSFDDEKKERYIEKRKQKYFKKKIDPDFEPTFAKPSAPPQAEAKSSTASSSANTSSHSQSTTDSTNSEQQQPNTSSRSSYGAYRAPQSKLGGLLSPLLNYYYLASQWFVVVCAVLSLIAPAFHYRALYATLLMYLVNTVQTNGRPQFNMYYAQRVLQDENVMIAVYAAIFLMGNPVFVYLLPIVLRSLYMATYLLNGLLSVKIPSLYQRIRPLTQRILLKRGWFNQTVALLEALMGVFLIFSCFFMSKTVVLTFIYWQVMHARYMMSILIQQAFGKINQSILGVVSRVPFVLNLYTKLTGYLWTMVDPQRLQQQMQDAQSGSGAAGGLGGMASGLMKKCVIM